MAHPFFFFLSAFPLVIVAVWKARSGVVCFLGFPDPLHPSSCSARVPIFFFPAFPLDEPTLVLEGAFHFGFAFLSFPCACAF